MINFRIAALSLALSLASLIGCAKNNKTAFEAFHADGRAKPKVALLPIQSPSTQVAWSIGDEISNYIEDNLLKIGSVYLARKESTLSQHQALEGKDVSELDAALKEMFAPNEFLVECKMVNHEFLPAEMADRKIPASLKGQIAGVVTARFKVQIIDLRPNTPKIILHEVIEEDELIHTTDSAINYEKLAVESKAYKDTPLYKMHRSLADTVSRRLAEYIVIAKSRTFQ